MSAQRLVLLALVASLAGLGCSSDDGGGAGGEGGAAGTGGGEPTTGVGGAGGAGEAIDPAYADQDTLDACDLPEPCEKVFVSNLGGPDDDDYACLWETLATTDAAATFTYESQGDGCPGGCPVVRDRLYVSAGVAVLSQRGSTARRCTIKPTAFFQGCLDAAEAGGQGEGCRSFGDWVEGCLEEPAACP
jgi:hypothetical protein